MRKLNNSNRNFKKEALMEERFTEIERENRILLEKMTQIMNCKHPSSLKTQRKTFVIIIKLIASP